MTKMREIRRAVVDDAQTCAAIVSNWLFRTRWIANGPDLEELTQILRKGIPIREFWVIGEPVQGYVSLELKKSHIHGLYVAEQGRGLGTALVDKVKEGRDFLQLYTHIPNEPAHRFYHREGFETVEKLPEGPGDGVGELRMEWHR
jgi:putative acetyltransferase